jgi:hypothetical protein
VRECERWSESDRERVERDRVQREVEEEVLLSFCDVLLNVQKSNLSLVVWA